MGWAFTRRVSLCVRQNKADDPFFHKMSSCQAGIANTSKSVYTSFCVSCKSPQSRRRKEKFFGECANMKRHAPVGAVKFVTLYRAGGASPAPTLRRTKKTSRSGRLFCSDLYSLLYATAILLAAWALLYASSRLEAKDLPPVISLICASRYGVMFLPWMCSAFACATARSMMPFM